MRLIVLPCDPYQRSGYNRAVAADLRRLGDRVGDLKLVYLERFAPIPVGFEVVRRPRRFALKRAANLILGRTFTETFASELRPFVMRSHWDEVFCGEVTFYRALRLLLPTSPMTVRFHNYFTLSELRRRARDYPIGIHFATQLRLFCRLEREIVSDPLVSPVFINPRERDLFGLQWPMHNAAVWGIDDPTQHAAIAPVTARFIYVGSTAGHQAFGLRLFIDRVLPVVRHRIGAVELHLWGMGTDRFHQPSAGVYGYGFRKENDLPFGGDGLFIIPDLLGGGIKVKTADALNNGRAFITTPFGMEGYMPHPDPNILVADFEEWAEVILSYFEAVGARPGGAV
jgi:hypothetical protein